MPYRNFVAHTLSETKAEEGEAYFKELLGDIEESTAPYGLLDVYGDGSSVVEKSQMLDAELSRRIRAVSKQRQVTPATLFHMAWGLVVSRCSGREEVVFGTMMSGRLQGAQGSDRILGMFLNMLPLRLSVNHKLNVEEYLAETHARLIGLLPYEQVPLSTAQRCSGVASGLPLFSAMINYRHSGKGADTTGGLSAQEHDRGFAGIELLGGEERNNYPFALNVDDLEEGFSITAQIVDKVDVGRIVSYVVESIESLVGALLEDEQCDLDSLSILPAAERDQVLYEFNDTEANYPKDKCIHELFEEQVAVNPHAIALMYGEQSLSYEALNGRANQLAHRLIKEGVLPDTLVGICVERSLEMVVGLLGTLKAGGAYVPLDPSYPEERLSYMLEDSGASIILSQKRLLKMLPTTNQRVICLDSDALYNNQATENVELPQLSPDHLAYVIYTSGTTGNPKGVQITHSNLVNFLASMEKRPGMNSEDRLLAVTSVSFDIHTLELFMPLMCGGELVVSDQESVGSAARLGQLLSQHQITIMQATPSTWQMLLYGGWRASTALKVLCGGESFSEDLKESLVVGSEIEFWNMYGPTETSVWSAVSRLRSSEEVVIGGGIDNTQIYILDEQNEPVPLGAVGEIHIGGAGVARGYLNQPALTGEKFVEDKFNRDTTGRLYKTGDLGSWNKDGTIRFLGRNDHQVKIRGYRIELGEIESGLRAEASVEDALVVSLGEGQDKRLVGYVTAAQKDTAEEGQEAGAG